MLAGTSEPILAAVVAWREGLAALLGDALGDRAAGVDVDALADHVFVTFEGAFLLARSTGRPRPHAPQLGVLRRLLAAFLAPV